MERIQKIIAESGEYSRRAVEKLIDQGKIKVNGVILRQKGLKIDPAAVRISIDGKPFRYKAKEELEAIIINKPRQVVVTRSDPEGRKTIYDLLPKHYSTFKPVGRLDFNSQGALILTNDGDLILKLTHPRYHLEKVYYVKTSSHPDLRQLDRMRKGVIIEGERTLPAKVEVLEVHRTSSLLEFKLTEGRNRQIRRMCEAVGLTVKELKRVAIGPIQLKKLRSGQFRHLSRAELKLLDRRLDGK